MIFLENLENNALGIILLDKCINLCRLEVV